MNINLGWWRIFMVSILGANIHLLPTENWHVEWSIAESSMENLWDYMCNELALRSWSLTWSRPSSTMTSLPRWLAAPFLILTEVLFLIHFSRAWLGTTVWRCVVSAAEEGCWLSDIVTCRRMNDMTSADSQKLKKMVLVMHFLKASQSWNLQWFWVSRGIW